MHLSRTHLHAAVNPLERINVPGLPQTPPEPPENAAVAWQGRCLRSPTFPQSRCPNH